MPEDWVTEKKIRDPDQRKPDDWDESAPKQIDDPNAVMPEGWLEGEPLTIEDPDATKPETWNDEEAGEWKAPQIPNPKCKEAPGCGPWHPPHIDNPEYKGPWLADLIDNPLYKGEWTPKKIPNPEHFTTDSIPAGIAPFSTLFFELWTVNANAMFDNILVTTETNLELIDNFTKATHGLKSEREKAAEKAQAKKLGEHERVSPESQFTLEALTAFWDIFQSDPIKAVTNFPILFGCIMMVIIGIPVTLFTVSMMGSSSTVSTATQSKKDDGETDTKEKEPEVVKKSAGGGETVVKRQRRTTRGSEGEAEVEVEKVDSDETANN
eukprot:TRINITY_DN79772_c0_g1_i1.p1 TRINITY_DN79772_c0_g1~~TRINITY_DN79772_c0_g1_i1.p1  ORF type:complete len:346 (-),score=57.61 TRINITY_DN79772_c0_g1_i1:51-1019(-)